MKRFIATLATIWRLALPYFRSEDRWPGRALLAAVIAMELGIVALNVMFNQWTNRFYNALQEYQWDTFVSELLWFCMLATIFITLAVYQLYLNQWLQIRWRRWMTVQYLGGWLDAGNHYRMQLVGDAADNPDQRIAEDIQLFVERTLNLSIQFLSSIVTLVSFVVILWQLSAQAPLHLFGAQWQVTGYLVWAAVIYAALGTWLTHLVGRALIWLNFYQQRYEADFRFNLVRVRENAEQIALLSGEPEERRRLLDRFGFVVSNWRAIMTRTKWLTGFTSGYSQFSSVFPFVVVSPAYFAKAIPFGDLDPDRVGIRQRAGRAVGYRDSVPIDCRMARGDRTLGRLLGRDRGRTHHRDGTAPSVEHEARRKPAGSRFGGPRAALAERPAADRRRRTELRARRSRAGHRSDRLRQVDAVPRDRRHLAVRIGDDHGPGGRQADGAAAAALPARSTRCAPLRPIRRRRIASVPRRSVSALERGRTGEADRASR